jgi:hypothetical protein
MNFREFLNEVVTDNAIEYVKRDLFKGKKLKNICKSFIKKFKGNGAFVGNVDYTEQELYDAVMTDIAEYTINIAKKYKSGMGTMALNGSVDKFNVDVEELKAKIKEIAKDDVNGLLK